MHDPEIRNGLQYVARLPCSVVAQYAHEEDVEVIEWRHIIHTTYCHGVGARDALHLGVE